MVLTGNSGDEPERPQDPEGSEGLGVHSFDVEAGHEDVEEANHDDGEVEEIPCVLQVSFFMLPEPLGNNGRKAFNSENYHENYFNFF